MSAHEIPESDLSELDDITHDIYKDYDYISIPSEKFDTVTMLDVVEHVINPQYLINNCYRILKNSGLIYFHTPIVTKIDIIMHFMVKIPFLKKIGTIWLRGRTSIFHLENYTPRSLKILLRNAGFRDVNIKIMNELSWPIKMYVKIYLIEKQGLPNFLVPIITPFFIPFLGTKFFNSNKAIVTARKINF